jgi:excisionase family DNA binding protein
MITQQSDSVVISGRPLLGEVYRAVLNHIAHRRANGTPSDDLRQLAKMLYRAYLSPARHGIDSAADTPAGSKGQDDDLISVGEAAHILGLSRRSVQRMCADPGGLSAIRIGHTWALRRSVVLALAQQRKQAS